MGMLFNAEYLIHSFASQVFYIHVRCELYTRSTRGAQSPGDRHQLAFYGYFLQISCELDRCEVGEESSYIYHKNIILIILN